ncbi:MAG TPA: S16 family serine protease, partial [Candidatus Thermoplasmatota archaeon]|nr:S16 family serine protease [Candidatus Thermoplasmatota archaeon]
LLAALLLVPLLPAGDAQPERRLRDTVTVQAAAVGHTQQGLVGSIATVSITVEENGTGQVFMDTYPLTEVDMQGSARLAVQVASAVTGLRLTDYNFYFVIRSGSEVIGGPSAGAVMAVGAVAALKEWRVNGSVMMTGTINPDGSIGPVGGVPEKARAARDTGHVFLFLYPEGQEEVPVQTERGFGRLNMTTYCRDDLGITCLPVGTIEEAARYMTGYDLQVPLPAGPVITPEFMNLMRPLSEELVAESRALLEEAQRAIATIPASGNRDLAAAAYQQLRLATEATANAERAFNESRFYASSSLSFQANIAARTVIGYTGLFHAEDPVAWTVGRIERAEENATEAMEAAKGKPIRSPAVLEAVGAAQSRATEAERRIQDARLGVRPEAVNLVEAVSNAAWADARADTVRWWLRIADTFPDAPDFRIQLAQTAVQAIAAGEQSMAYTSALLGEYQFNDANGLLSLAREKLEDARKDRDRGLYAAALYEAIEATVRSGVVLQALGYNAGGVPERAMERAKASAASAILLARSEGNEPVLAVSYYELAQGFEGRQRADAFTYYQLARNIASVGDLLKERKAERSAVFVGDPDVPIPSWLASPVMLNASFAFGLGIGVLAAVLILLPPKKWPPAKRDAEPPAPAIPGPAEVEFPRS